jgi:Glyoxalase-like domain
VLSFDHAVLAVADLDDAGERLFHDHGLGSVPGGRHPRWGTANRIVPLGDGYIELMAVVDTAVGRSTELGRAVLGLTADGEDRWFVLSLADTDIEATALRLGLEVEDGSRVRPDGTVARWRAVGVEDEARAGWLPFFIDWQVLAGDHPGRVAVEHRVAPTGIARVEFGGDPKQLRAWLGDDRDDLPIDLVDASPGLRAVTVALVEGAELTLRPAPARDPR